jgi:quercetin dioxygenase-like cupin family protein
MSAQGKPGEQHEAGFWAQPEELSVESTRLDFEPGCFNVEDLPKFSPIPGVEMLVMAGKQTMANWVRIAPNVGVPLHAHPHEQLGLVIEGSITMTIGERAETVGPGQCYRIPGNLMHAGLAGPDGCLVVDIFSPLRDDYVAAAK